MDERRRGQRSPRRAQCQLAVGDRAQLIIEERNELVDNPVPSAPQLREDVEPVAISAHRSVNGRPAAWGDVGFFRKVSLIRRGRCAYAGQNMDRRCGECNVLTVEPQGRLAVANQVAVTRITIEYVCDGRTFTMAFNDPSTVDSIVFSQRDRQRLKAKQNELAKKNPPEATPVVEHKFNPLASGPEMLFKDESHPPASISVKEGGAASTSVSLQADRSLWWHGASCAWFHPEGDQ